MISRAIALTIAAILTLSPNAVAQDPWWTQRAGGLDGLLAELVACADSAGDRSRCDRFIARALVLAYCVDDLDLRTKANADDPGDSVGAWLEASDDWEFLGGADDQNALIMAQAAANSGMATLAVSGGDADEHVALVLPGRLAVSGRWRLSVPNSASFFAHKPDQSYIGRGLSFAFRSPERVKLYTRSFTPCLPRASDYPAMPPVRRPR